MNKRLGTKGDVDDVLSHPFFEDINMQDLKGKKIKAPYIPLVNDSNLTINFDPLVTEQDAWESFVSEDMRRDIVEKIRQFESHFDDFGNND